MFNMFERFVQQVYQRPLTDFAVGIEGLLRNINLVKASRSAHAVSCPTQWRWIALSVWRCSRERFLSHDLHVV